MTIIVTQTILIAYKLGTVGLGGDCWSSSELLVGGFGRHWPLTQFGLGVVDFIRTFSVHKQAG